MPLTLNLSGPHALKLGDQKTIVINVEDADGDPHSMTSHTCKFQARPSYEHETAWVELDETDGITLTSGKITILVPAISTTGRENGLLGVFDCVLYNASGEPVLQAGGEFEALPTAIR